MNSILKRFYPLSLILFSVLLMTSCKNTEVSDKNTVTLNSDNFDQTINKGVVLVDFWATWCRPCQIQGPIVAELAGKYKGKITVGKIDIDQNGDLAGTYNIQSIPTLMIFVEGKPVETLVGLRSKDALEELINKYIQK